jgi:RNA polymerase sigma factor (sigma-70 family)
MKRRLSILGSPEEFLPTRNSLLTRLKNWDDSAGWQRFFDTYWRLIYSAAIKSGLSDAEAQEVVQETVISVAKKMKEFKYDPAMGSFKGWLLNLTHWRITDQIRKRARHEGCQQITGDREMGEGDIAVLPDQQVSQLEALWDSEWQQNLMAAALERVKRKANAGQYQVFDLYAVKEWPVADVAKTLGVSKFQVYKAKSRVSALLREEIERLQTELM